MRKARKKEVGRILLHEFRVMGGKNRFIDAAALDDGTLLIQYEHRSTTELAGLRDKVHVARYLVVARPDGSVCGAFITSQEFKPKES